jgi:hypothetical protein
MNDKTIFGGGTAIPLIISPGSTNVIVGNGTLQNSTVRGALITTCTEITLTNVNFVSTNSALLISLCGDVTVANCFFSSNQSRIVDIANSNRISVINSIFSSNIAGSPVSMIDINGSSTCITIDSNKMCSNTAYESIIAMLSVLSSGIKISNCVMDSNLFVPGPTLGAAWVIRVGAAGLGGPSGYLIQNCLIQSNSLPNVAGTLLIIDNGLATGTGWNVNNCIIQNNSSTGAVRGINVGPGGAVEFNSVSNNTSAGSFGIVFGGVATRVIGNRVQGQVTNFTPGGNIALVQISFATGTTTTVSAGNVTPYHNLEMVP